jgi:GGDEF domain-containing protein
MSFLKRLLGRVAPASADRLPPAAAEQVAAAVDLQKTMGRDRVTGLPHRACFAYVVTLQGQIAARLETRLSVVVLDWPGYATELDPERRDRRLNQLAAGLRDGLQRTHDVLGCIGEGRLAAMLPFTDGAGADTVARNLQRAAQAALAARRATVPAAKPATAPAAEGPDGPTQAPPQAADNGTTAPPETEQGEVDGEIINVGISSYNGKGVLSDDALLKAAERAVAFAAMNGGDRVVRSDPGADTAR